MTPREQIYNWLRTVLKQPVEEFSEIFYYDKMDNQFFSILVSDYFMFDKDLKIAKGASSNYTKEDLKILVDRIRRIDAKDPEIVAIPRYGSSVEEAFISAEIHSFLEQNIVSPEQITIWQVEENVEVRVLLEDVPSNEINPPMVESLEKVIKSYPHIRVKCKLSYSYLSFGRFKIELK